MSLRITCPYSLRITVDDIENSAEMAHITDKIM